MNFPSIFSKRSNEKQFKQKCIVGEDCPSYLIDPLAPKRIANHYSKMKFIVLLRNPIDRAYSLYHKHVKSSVNETLSFLEAIDQEEKRIQNSVEEIIAQEYFTSQQSIYNYVQYMKNPYGKK